VPLLLAFAVGCDAPEAGRSAHGGAPPASRTALALAAAAVLHAAARDALRGGEVAQHLAVLLPAGLCATLVCPWRSAPPPSPPRPHRPRRV